MQNLIWAITSTIAVFHIGSRRKEELLHLITDAFVGWLVRSIYPPCISHQDGCNVLEYIKQKIPSVKSAWGAISFV